MLYDILPPLLLLASLGGIISVLSRVVIRVQRDQISAEIKAHAVSTRPVVAEPLLQKSGSRLHLITDRLASVKQGVAGARKRLQRAGSASGTKITSGAKSVSGGFRGMLERRRERKELRRIEKVEAARVETVEGVMTEAEEVQESASKPFLRRIVHEEKKAEKAKVPSTVEKLLGKTPVSEKLGDPLTEARVCLKERKFKKAEDILVPYIVQHTRDTKAYMLLGRAAALREQWDEAFEIYKQVQTIDAAAKGLNAALGIAALHSGKITEAMQALQHARDEEPHNTEIREQLLILAQRMDNKVLKRTLQEELRELASEKEATAKAEA